MRFESNVTVVTAPAQRVFLLVGFVGTMVPVVRNQLKALAVPLTIALLLTIALPFPFANESFENGLGVSKVGLGLLG